MTTEPLEPRELQKITVAIAMGGDTQGGIDTAVTMLRDFAPEEVPDVGQARKALTVWGIIHKPGVGIRQMFTTTRTLAVALPPGWAFSRRGGGGHVELLDATGASRLRWHIHGWDPISLSVNERYYTKLVDLSVNDAVLQVYDGTIVIHTILLRYPHTRINDPHSDGTPFYKSGYPGEDAGWTREMGRENYSAKENMSTLGCAWLDENRPNHRSYIGSWL